MENVLYKILVTGTAPELFPVETLFGLLYYHGDEVLEITKQYPFQGGWDSSPKNIHIFERIEYPMPKKIDLVWISIVEQKAYSVETLLPTDYMQKCWESFAKKERDDYCYINVGMASYGGMAVWICSNSKSFLVSWIKADPFEIDEELFKLLNNGNTYRQLCLNYITLDSRVRENLHKNGLPPRDLFDNYMKQFTYRYQVEFGHWDEEKEVWSKDDGTLQTASSANTDQPTPHINHPSPEFDYIEEALYDGTHDKLHDGGLMKYHEAGKPKKLVVRWHIEKKEWTAYFWFEDEEIRRVFDRFYGVHPETKTDFLFHIDPDKNKYELSLYRFGKSEPQIIGETAYQLIVFKNMFECFRSKNYNQPRGAWIW